MKMDVARERTSSILELREILMTFQTGFYPVNAAVDNSSTDTGWHQSKHFLVSQRLNPKFDTGL